MKQADRSLPVIVAKVVATVALVPASVCAQATKVPQLGVPPLEEKAAKVAPEPTAVLAEIARKIESTMAVKATVPATRDPDGHLGIFIDSEQPCLTPPRAPGMDIRKMWVLLATFTALSAAEGSPVLIDYIGFTDPEGAHGKRWFFQLNMADALSIQKGVFSGELTSEQGYEKLTTLWRRVTRT